jgi:hypothetical protein
MKRSEIKNGDVLYYDPSVDWRKPIYIRRSQKVVVKDVTVGYQNVARDAWSTTQSPTYKVADRAKGILVVNADKKDAEPFVAQPAHLRGPWEATHAGVEAALVAEKSQQAEQLIDREASLKLMETVEAIADRLGLTGIRRMQMTSEEAFRVPLKEMYLILHELRGFLSHLLVRAA